MSNRRSELRSKASDLRSLILMRRNVDKREYDPLTAAEEPEVAEPLITVKGGKRANAPTEAIPGTGRIVRDGTKEKRIVTT
jgi:hypothetical protein